MILTIKNRIIESFNRIKQILRALPENPELKRVIAFRDSIMERSRTNVKDRNRFLLIGIGSLLLLDYLMFCYHTDKNIFSIFPTIPIMEDKREIEVYLPGLDGETIFKEKRQIMGFPSDERFVRYLFNTVRKGSQFDNTSIMVPVELQIRNIWITDVDNISKNEKLCVVDVEVPVIEKDITPLQGSELLFKEAFRQTVKANIPSITEITILERGIPDKKLWDVVSQ
ncbi:MAG: hypothetical protein CVV44_18320 [Spirochaetae bacterium HGW-Spirochaetae-1]|jgi:hypothetical protein|nr:MAG: hypothetical protein CVV44_18320 [Spirochaetae bacterium HGW-Spirochaetae-1]